MGEVSPTLSPPRDFSQGGRFSDGFFDGKFSAHLFDKGEKAFILFPR